MSSDVISAFMKAIEQDDNLKTQLMAADADVLAIASAAGFELDAQALAQLQSRLPDSHLDAVAGGSWFAGSTHYCGE